MDLSRLRDIVKGTAARPGVRELTYVPEIGPRSSLAPKDLAEMMGGGVIETSAGACLSIEREYDAWRHYGRQRVGDWITALDPARAAADPLAVLGRAWRASPTTPVSGDSSPVARDSSQVARESSRVARDFSPAIFTNPRRLMFVDLETTGLTGGAGNHAFLVGCGHFDEDDGFITRQLFLTSFGGERALLTLLSEWLASCDAIVTYNGRTFDVPIIETRWLFHRMEPPLAEKPHFDMLHPARCLWRDRDRTSAPAAWGFAGPGFDPPAPDGASCSLGALERLLLGFTRIDDVEGFEIPSVYFHYLRTGDVAPLEAVLEHNRLDLLSLAGVTARVAGLVTEGAAGANGARECLALGRLYEKAGEFERATACYARAAGVESATDRAHWAEEGGPDVRGDALRRLALRYRRDRRYAEAAVTWRRILELEQRSPLLDWEAMEALAIHHEHRVKDLPRARDFAMRTLRAEMDADRRRAVHHRLARLDRKLDRRAASSLL